MLIGCPASQPLRRHGHERHLFEMALRLGLVQERRLPVKPAIDYVVHGQQVSIPRVSTRSVEFWGAVLPMTWGSDDIVLARLPGTRPQLRRDLCHTLTAHPQAEFRASYFMHSGRH